MNEKEFLLKIGSRIVQIRKKKGIKQIDLAASLDIEDSALRRIEKGGTNPTILTLHKIAKALDVKIQDFLDFD